MSIEPCETMRLVEARYDGRLGDRESASLDRHLATCPTCRAHAVDLPRLRALVLPVIVPQMPIEQQRSRARLLNEAARIEPRSTDRARPRWATGVLLAAAMLAAAFVGWTLRARAIALSPPSETARTPLVLASASATAPAAQPVRTATSVTPERGARFAQSSSGGMETVLLDEGTATFSVRPLGSGERFLVKASDGEVDLHGGVARVEVTNAKIRRVTVQEGAAEVRYGGAVFELEAGGAWIPPATAEAPSPPAVAPPSPPTPAARAAHPSVRSSAARALTKPVAAKPTQAAPPATEPVAAAPSPEPPKPEVGATDFADAVRLFERGDYPSAVRHLAEFSKRHPEDGRAEDAAFLAVLSLQRTGKTAEAAAAARRYLQAYPAGYRRAEAAKIAAKR